MVDSSSGSSSSANWPLWERGATSKCPLLYGKRLSNTTDKGVRSASRLLRSFCSARLRQMKQGSLPAGGLGAATYARRHGAQSASIRFPRGYLKAFGKKG